MIVATAPFCAGRSTQEISKIEKSRMILRAPSGIASTPLKGQPGTGDGRDCHSGVEGFFQELAHVGQYRQIVIVMPDDHPTGPRNPPRQPRVMLQDLTAMVTVNE